MGRFPDTKAVRRSKDKASIVHSSGEPALRKPLSVELVPALSDTWDVMVGSGMAFDARDAPLLEQLVFDIETARQCREQLVDEFGNVRVMVGRGEPDPDTGEYMDCRPNPLLKVMREAVAESMKLSDQLGCTPMARARLGLTQAAGKAVTISIADSIDRALKGAAR